jgi:photosystem II stability/assembly factor-like uncharacterized protein
MSSDGSLLTFFGGNPSRHVWTSQDYGATWTERLDAGIAGGINNTLAASSDGKRLVTAINETTGATVYTSSDQGASWTKQWTIGDSKKYAVAVASSSDGRRLFMSVGDADTAQGRDSIYTSADYGATWEPQPVTGQRQWQVGSLAASADGTRFAATAPDAGVLTFRFAP